MPLSPGDVVGNYRVLSAIGRGGMGAVYLAEHPLIGKRVALKVIHQELAARREIVTRFFNEARAVNQIGNDHIVEIHDFGQTPAGEYFFVMEYLDGRNLAQVLLQEGALAVVRAQHIAAQIASALGAAHACAIVHRDLKPDNIMLVPRLGDPDFVKVLDFGLAKMVAQPNQAITAQGVVLGTPHYMSPEACDNPSDIDHRADIYSL
ncbi:MAG: serine/threonine-protein kinase, partial [Myxococcota bacterium]